MLWTLHAQTVKARDSLYLATHEAGAPGRLLLHHPSTPGSAADLSQRSHPGYCCGDEESRL